MNNKKTAEFYKAFYEENRVAVLQYNSLRGHFNKMVTNVLGANYYNGGMDVYECDRMCCEDVTEKSKPVDEPVGFFKSIFNRMQSII